MKLVRIKHFWLELKTDKTTEEFIDELDDLCSRYARATIHHPHYEFDFQEED